MKHTVCAVCAILEAPQQQFQPAKVPSKKKKKKTCTRQKVEQIIILRIPEVIIFQLSIPFKRS